MTFDPHVVDPTDADHWERLAASLLASDGTFNLSDGERFEFESGIQVGGIVPTLVDPTPTELAQWLWRHDITHPGAEFVGSWLDPETGERHIDLSEHFPLSDIRDALLTARRRGEKAVWIWDIQGVHTLSTEG